MIVRLRPHHLLCVLTYAGKGYGPAFTANYDGVVRLLAAGADVEIVSGPDDICVPLLAGADPHCLRASVDERDALAAIGVGQALGVSVAPGARLRLPAETVDKLRRRFAAREVRQACTGCEWSALCDRIAAAGFAGVALPGAPTWRGSGKS
ncbi:DUF1284 domain-containing protein [Devosia nitrariae]|uniref:(2Fe-2S) ferredoxin n=1 Tax=Devosia nitrariae TaxID=2071872 RepID=A0ABQ5W9Q1_9HYPH|nr:DUF1284 domain-containing protein [Devosia nitrariae]GLQ56275.1 (2Fe-2S) ferredoxin [Devosia nitrariae]